MEYVAVICIIVFGGSIPFFLKRRAVLEEQGFEVKQHVINGVLGVIFGLILLLVALSR